jgi:large repetitive protein
MIAASLLVAAVVAAYASLAMLSLSASTSGIVLGAAANVESLVGSVGWHPPSVKDVGGYVGTSSTPTIGNGAVSISSITVGRARGTTFVRTVRVGNSSAKPLRMRVAVVGNQRLGVTASFAAGGTTMLVPAHGAEPVVLVTDPLQAGVIDAELRISVPGSNLAPQSVPIYGTQSPEPPTGAVTATAAAGGAVALSWNPSPSTGVTDYIVKSSTGGSPFTQVGSPTTGTSAVEQTGTNATTFSYEVVAVAAGVTLPSAPGLPASVTTDSQGPAAPNIPNPPQYINQATVGSFGLAITLPQSAAPGDTTTVTLSTASNGTTLTQTVPGDASPFHVSFPGASTLAEGSVSVTATSTDSLGNPGQSFSRTITKDTIPPDAAMAVQPPDLITSANVTQVPILVTTDPTDAGFDVVSTLTSGSQSQTSQAATAPVGGGIVTTYVDASALPDGLDSVTATVTDEAGNAATSPPGVTVQQDRSGPEKPATFGIAAGPNNPAGVINAQSQTAVTIVGHFADPLAAGETITISIDQGTPLPVDVVPGTQDITLGPLDLSGLPDGQVALKMKLTDADGNVSLAWRDNGVKETSGPTGPSSVGVPAGPDNPAGYVNTATQSSATIVAAFAAPTDPADQISLSVGGDSNFPVQPGGSDQVIWNNLDLSSLSDGTLPVVVTVTDANGNSSSVSGTLIKDTQAPPAPVAAHVLGPPLDTIQPGDASCVNVGVAFNQAPDPSDTVTVTLSDGHASAQGSTQAGDGQVTVGCIDASSLAAGSVAVSVTVTDVAGNSTTMAGTSATKSSCHQGSE